MTAMDGNQLGPSEWDKAVALWKSQQNIPVSSNGKTIAFEAMNVSSNLATGAKCGNVGQ